MSTKLIAGAVAAALSMSTLAFAPAAQAHKGGKHWHGHHHRHFGYRYYGPVCADWGWVRRHGERKYVCLAWY